MEKEIIKKCADAHKKSSLYSKELNYDLTVDALLKKDPDICIIFRRFVDEKFTSNDTMEQAMALQFQAAVDWLMYSTTPKK